MSEFYHVFIRPKEGVTYEQVEKTMNLAVDWFRCTQEVWVIYTTSDHNKWQARLKPLVSPQGSLFICRLDIRQRNGWMDKKFWEWIREKTQRPQQPPA